MSDVLRTDGMDRARSNRLSAAVAARRRSGAPLLDLTETNPTRVGLRAPADVLAALADPAPSPTSRIRWGRPAAREAVAADDARRGLDVDPDRLLLTASTSEAYAFLFKLLVRPGRRRSWCRVPSYPLFEYLAGLRVGARRALPARATTASWHLDIESLRQARSRRARARSSSSVPTTRPASFSSADERAALRALCAERGLAAHLRRGLRRLRAAGGPAARGERCSRTARPWPSPWAASRSRAACPSSSWPGSGGRRPGAAARRGAGAARGRGRHLPVRVHAGAGGGSGPPRAR